MQAASTSWDEVFHLARYQREIGETARGERLSVGHLVLWDRTRITNKVVCQSAVAQTVSRRLPIAATRVPRTKTKPKSMALVRERTIPTERPSLLGEVVPTFADRRCRVVSATDSHGR
jgi:hypothetical protein